MGQRASNTTGVTFEDVVVPNEVGKVSNGNTFWDDKFFRISYAHPVMGSR